MRLCALAAASFLLACHIPAHAQELTEEKLAKLNDWVIDVRLAPIPRFKLNRPNRTSDRPVKAVITYRLFPRPGKMMRDTSEHTYEELYYDIDAPLGQRRFSALNLPTGESGCIRLADNDSLTDNPATAADVLVHLCLDISLNDNKLGMVIVPKDNWESVTGCLPAHKFIDPKQSTQGAKKTSISLYVVSNPKTSKTEKTFFYTRM